MRTEGEGEADHEQQRRHGAQRQRIALRNPRVRQVGAERAERRGEALLVLAPERGGKGILAPGQTVALGRNRRVLQAIGAFDAPVDLGGAGKAETPERQQGGEGGEAERDGERDPRPVWNEAENAEPGGAEEEAGNDGQRQDQRPQALGGDRDIGRRTRAPEPPAETGRHGPGPVFVSGCVTALRHRAFRRPATPAQASYIGR